MRAGDAPAGRHRRPSCTRHPNNLFVAGFIGSPSMNFLPGELDGDTREAADRRRAASPTSSATGSSPARAVAAAASSPACAPSTSRTPASSATARAASRSRRRSTCSSRWARSSTPTSWSSPRADFLARARGARGRRRRRGPADRGGRQPDRRAARAPRARSRRAQEAELWFDSTHLQLFDPESGPKPAGAAAGPASKQATQVPAAARAGRAGLTLQTIRPRRAAPANLERPMPSPRSTGLPGLDAQHDFLRARAARAHDRQADGAPARRARRRRGDPPLRGGDRGARLRQRALGGPTGRAARSIVGIGRPRSRLRPSVPPHLGPRRGGAGSRSRPRCGGASRCRRSTC